MDWLAGKGDVNYVEFEMKTRPLDLYPCKTMSDVLLGIYLEADRLCTDITVAAKNELTERYPGISVVY